MSASRSVDSPDELQAERARAADCSSNVKLGLPMMISGMSAEHALHDLRGADTCASSFGVRYRRVLRLVVQPDRVIRLDVEALLVRQQVRLDAAHGLLDPRPSGASP